MDEIAERSITDKGAEALLTPQRFANIGSYFSSYSIWTTKIDGSNLTQIIFDSEMDCIFPTASPNGQYIAYVKQLPNINKTVEMQSRDIYIFNFQDNLSQQITTNISRDDMPHWSTEGDFLYFRSSRRLSWNVWRLPTTFLNQ